MLPLYPFPGKFPWKTKISWQVRYRGKKRMFCVLLLLNFLYLASLASCKTLIMPLLGNYTYVLTATFCELTFSELPFYYTKISVGTPPLQFSLIMDTGR